MITFCVLCRTQIPESRQHRAARTCSVECQKRYRREYLADRFSRFCKACGRPLKRTTSGTRSAKGTVFLASEGAFHELGRGEEHSI